VGGCRRTDPSTARWRVIEAMSRDHPWLREFISTEVVAVVT
jgi:hypothetical protein